MPNVLTEKLGPLPLWGWLGIATVGVLLVASKGKKSSSTDNSAAAQQQLAAEEAALANSAQTAQPANTGSTYGSGGSAYSGNGNTGYTAPVYSTTPAASTTDTAAAMTATSSGSGGSGGSSVAASTAPGPVSAWTSAPEGQSVQSGSPNSPYTTAAPGAVSVPGGFMIGNVFYPAGPQGQTLTGAALQQAYQENGFTNL